MELYIKYSFFVSILFVCHNRFIESKNIGLEEFKEKIATSDQWISLYRVEIGQPTERIKRKIKAKWTMLDTNNTVLRNTVAWSPDVDKCGLLDVTSEPDESDSWGKGGVVLKQVNSTFKRQSRFVSSDSSSYFWWVVCFNGEDIVDGVCPDLIVVLMIPSSRLVYERQADMTGLHIQDINRDLRSINDTASFGDNRLRYNWLGSECDFSANKMIAETDCISGTDQLRITYGCFSVLAIILVYVLNIQRN